MNDHTAYVYDGSFQGLLTCIFQAFDEKADPAEIRTDDKTLLPCVFVETDESKALRVKNWLMRALGREFAETVSLAYLSRVEGAETDILRYVRLAHVRGKNVARDLCDPLVHRVCRLATSVNREKHRIIEFLRFSDYDGWLMSVINPKHFVLPLIAGHFERRFPNEKYFIYDETHGAALSHENGETKIFPVAGFTAAPPTAEEEKFRRLWKLFYDTIEIKERRNHKLRMQHLPKRFWKNITELCGEL